jgi:4-alpha-glucanotransferase
MTADTLAALARHAGIVPSYTDQTRRRRRTRRASMRALLARWACLRRRRRRPAETWRRLLAEEAARVLPPWACDRNGCCTLGAGGRRGSSWVPDAGGRRHAGGHGRYASRHAARPPRAARRGVGLHAHFRARAPAASRAVLGRDAAASCAATGGVGGLADYGDLAEAAEELAGLGADFLGLNPIHAGFWGDAGAFSPYTPSHRRRLSTFHLADGIAPNPGGPLIDYATEIPAAAGAGTALPGLRGARRRCGVRRLPRRRGPVAGGLLPASGAC